MNAKLFVLALLSATAWGPYAIGQEARNSVIDVPSACPTAGVYDQTCWTSAVAAGEALSGTTGNFSLVSGPRTYVFTAPVKVSGLSNVVFAGSGAGTIIKKDGIAFELGSCANCVFKDVQFQTVTQPTVVATSALPTPSASEAVVIDRWSSGKGYIPTGNDGDIIPIASGGSCAAKCLSAAQSSENFDTGILFTSPVACDVSGITGTYFSLVFLDAQQCRVHDNTLYGGKGQIAAATGAGGGGGGGILFWMANAAPGAWTNVQNIISNNTISYAAFDGIAVAHGDGNTITGNVVKQNGESGIKTWEGNGYYSIYTAVGNNVSEYNWYDGFDIGADYPETGRYYTFDTITGNVSFHNHQTGFVGDGNGVSAVGNTANLNASSGFLWDYGHGTIANNVGVNNNTRNDPGQGQMIIGFTTGTGNNTITGNSMSTSGGIGAAGYGIDIVNGCCSTQMASGNSINGGLPFTTNLNATVEITSTSMASGKATYEWKRLNGATPETGDSVTVDGTGNGGGMFNVKGATIASLTGLTSGTFVVNGLNGNFSPQLESGTAAAKVSCRICAPVTILDNNDGVGPAQHVLSGDLDVHALPGQIAPIQRWLTSSGSQIAAVTESGLSVSAVTPNFFYSAAKTALPKCSSTSNAGGVLWVSDATYPVTINGPYQSGGKIKEEVLCSNVNSSTGEEYEWVNH